MPTDALTGYVPGGLGLADDGRAGEVFADEIDPAWADDGGGAAPAEAAKRPAP
jgi:hypothetical protein